MVVVTIVFQDSYVCSMGRVPTADYPKCRASVRSFETMGFGAYLKFRRIVSFWAITQFSFPSTSLGMVSLSNHSNKTFGMHGKFFICANMEWQNQDIEIS